jgi:glucose/arabinose dehydrogenase
MEDIRANVFFLCPVTQLTFANIYPASSSRTLGHKPNLHHHSIMNKSLLAFAFMLLPLLLLAQPKIQLTNFATGFDLPVDIAHCGDSRIFVVERDGVIWVLDSLGARLDTFLNIDPRVNSNQNEQGLLGLAFHPNYAENGWFFVNYTKNNGGDTRIARFSVKPDNPNEADPNSELTILEQDQPYWNHNGGCMKFGPDGQLYISLGDGGSGGDPQNYGQNKKTFLGKILRINVDNSTVDEPYAIPEDNPFVGNADYFPEIWSLGWRNPWRFSFDRLTGDMWIADVGQNEWEEVNFEAAGAGGLNYGWRCYEGTHPYNTNQCQPANAYVMPFFEYPHSGGNGCSVTGGFIYRGTQFPDLYGCYLFADYCSGRWWYTRRNNDGTFTTNVLSTLSGYEYSSFGEDKNGELYVTLLSSGRVQRVRELCSPFQINLTQTIDSSCFDGLGGALFLASTGGAGNVTYTWSNGETGSSIIYLNPGIYTVEAKDGNNCIRRDTFEIFNATPPAPVTGMPDTAVCAGLNIQLPAIAPPADYTLQWYQNGQPVSPAPDGTVQITETSAFEARWIGACSSAFSTPINVLALDLPNVTLQANGNAISASVTPPDAQLQWYLNGVLIPGANGATYTAEETGNYTLIADNGGCQTVATIFVEISSVKMPDNIRRFNLSPNPTANTVLLEMDLKEAATCDIRLLDSSQRQVFNTTVTSAKVNMPIDMKKLPAGTYFLQIQTAQGSFVRQVIKK